MKSFTEVYVAYRKILGVIRQRRPVKWGAVNQMWTTMDRAKDVGHKQDVR